MVRTIGIIGAGKMGTAFYRGLTEAQGKDQHIWICDHHEAHLRDLNALHSCIDPNELLSNVDIAIIAVKPQSFTALTEMVTVDLSGKLILSIMAGISLERLQENFRSPFIVRSMPNLGAQIGHSVTAWIASAATDAAQKQDIQEILSSIGMEMELSDETQIDMFTALAGSGPAYFFHLCALLAGKAEMMGFTPAQASFMSREILLVSALLLQNGKVTAGEWRAAVASKGGTTEAALNVMKEKGFDAAFMEAVDAAYARSRSLSQ